MSDRGAPATADYRKGQGRCDAGNGRPSIGYGRIARVGRLVVSDAASKPRRNDRKSQHMLVIKIKSSPRYHWKLRAAIVSN
jgi:hypothetical protein